MKTNRSIAGERLVRSRITWVIAMVTTWLIFVGAPVDAKPKPRVLTWSGSAAAVSDLHLRGGNGDVNVKTTDGDQIRISVEVSIGRSTDDEPERKLTSWFLTSDNLSDDELLESITLRVDEKKGALDVTLRPGGRSRTARVKEKWTIALPARLVFETTMDAADVNVTGVAGGVYLRVGNGTVDLDLGGGDVDARVTVGELKVHTRGDYGKINVRSVVGDTGLWLRGMKIDYPDPPGPGSHASVDGEGDHRVRVEVEVGDVELRVN